MKKNFSRVVAILMILALVGMLPGCKGKKDPKKPIKKPTSSATVSAGDTASGAADEGAAQEEADGDEVDDDWSDEEDEWSDDDDYYEDTFGDDTYSEENFVILLDRPKTDGKISVGIKKGYKGTSSDEDMDDGEEFEDIEDLDDEEVPDYVIQPNGSDAKGTARTINIKNSKALYSGFTGIGTNVYPTSYTFAGQLKHKDIDAMNEINAKRFNSIAPSFARTTFQVDWMVTNEAGDNYKDYDNDYKSNPDYKNYMDGKYSFDSEEAKACIESWKMFDQMGTEIYLTFGWKNADRVAAWYGSDPAHPSIAAPKDVTAYANAAAALFKYAREDLKLKNFNTLSLYNEPDRRDNYSYDSSTDYTTIGDKCVYYASMLQECKRILGKEGITSDVKLFGAECRNKITANSEDYVNPYIRKNASQFVDGYSFHYYFTDAIYTSGSKDHENEDIIHPYDQLFENLWYVYNIYGETGSFATYLTECYYAGYDILGSEYQWDKCGGWDGSCGCFYVATANTGVNGFFKYSMVGGYLTAPQFTEVGNGCESSWACPLDGDSINEVHYSFYEESLLNNYIPKNAKVHYISWSGTDLRCSAFGGGTDFALLVVANDAKDKRDITAKLEKSLGGKKLYVYKFDVATMEKLEKSGNLNQATILPSVGTLNGVTNSIKYSLDAKYGMYIFSTIAPKKQLEIYNEDGKSAVYSTMGADEVLQLNVKGIDCTIGSNDLDWTVTKYSDAKVYADGGKDEKTGKPIKIEQKRTERVADGGSVGDITTDGTKATYTPALTAKPGDVIAVRCTLRGTKVFTSAIIEIQ